MKVAHFMIHQRAGKMTRLIKEIIVEIGLDGRIEVVETPKLRRFEQALYEAERYIRINRSDLAFAVITKALKNES